MRGSNLLCWQIWDNAEEGPSVLVRSWYEKLFEHVNDKVTKRDKTPTVVSGTPGIGKSFFGLYAARRWYDDGRLVILWYEKVIYVFSNSHKKKGQEEISANKKSIWWMRVREDDNDYLILKKDTEAILVRDPGQTKVVSPVSTLGFQLYNVSSGNFEFVRELKKNPTPILLVLRHMDLFDFEELIAALLCGCFLTSTGTFANPDATDVAALFMEGYRRYGGSARNVVNFAKLHRPELSPLTFDKYVLTLGPGQDIMNAVDWVTKAESSDSTVEVTSKALIFHRTPLSAPAYCNVNFASAYLRSLAVDRIRVFKVNALQRVIAALGAGDGQHDACGVLYEGEMHKEITNGDMVVFKPAYLGSYHQPGPGRCWEARKKVELNYQVSKVLNFPGKSLANFKFAKSSDIEHTYIQPIVGNFLTHDVFILVEASVFFEGTTTEGIALIA